MGPGVTTMTSAQLARPSGCLRGSQAAFRALQRPGALAARRPQLTVRADEAERSKAQDTVGDLKQDAVRSALDRQIQRSAAKTGTPASNSLQDESRTPAAGAKESAPVNEATPAPPQKATAEELETSMEALRQLRGRVPLMTQGDIDEAMNRLLGQDVGDSAEAAAGSSPGGRGSASSEDNSSSGASGSGSGSSGAAAPAQDSGKKGKHDPDQTFDDGSVLFTADTLSKVSFDDYKP